MRFLRNEREVLNRYAPGLDDRLAGYPMDELERKGGPGLDAFRLARCPGLLVPTEHGGSSLTAANAVRVTRAIGARAPSLAIAATMHHFSVASLVALARHSEGFEWMLLDGIARDRLLVASAFAEGRSGQGVFSPTMRATRSDSRWLITGNKKPCSLSRSADIITASVALEREDGGSDLGVALIPAHSEGIAVQPFWGAGVLTGAESDELVLNEVAVDDELIVRPELEPGSELDDLNTVGLIWFTLLISGAYLGIASALVERLLASERAVPSERARVATELEGGMLAVQGVASAVDSGRTDNDVLADALMARYTTQGLVDRTVTATVELLGGMSFVSSSEVSYLAGACRAFPFHPPSRQAMGSALDRYFSGEVLGVA